MGNNSGVRPSQRMQSPKNKNWQTPRQIDGQVSFRMILSRFQLAYSLFMPAAITMLFYLRSPLRRLECQVGSSTSSAFTLCSDTFIPSAIITVFNHGDRYRSWLQNFQYLSVSV